MSRAEGDRLAEFSLAVRQSSLKRLILVPEGLENWRAKPDAMSFADLARHLIDADEWLFKKLEVRTLEPMVGRAGLVHIQRREQFRRLLEELEQAGGRRADMLRRLTEAQLDELVFDRRFGKEVTIWWVIVRGNLDHEIHHRGQIAAYLPLATL
jgi:uncharacterized damage-inducible protein DinB